VRTEGDGTRGIHACLGTRPSMAVGGVAPRALSRVVVSAARADAARPGDPFGNVAAAYLVKVDGREVWARNADAPLSPEASRR